jgi:hypothetical protein
MYSAKRIKTLTLMLAEGVDMFIEQQQQLPPDPQQAPQPPQQAAAAQTQQTTPQDVAVGVDGQPLTIDSLIERLNVIRGGKSFSDPEVYGQLTTLFKSLSNDQKTTLDKVLTDIGKVVINAPNSEETTPAEPPAQPASTPAATQAPGIGQPAGTGAQVAPAAQPAAAPVSAV